jgi:drug/metabolite transporter (DMT)-like permease
MDALLLLMVVIWGANYSVAKRAFEEIPAPAFNGLRVAIASFVFLSLIGLARRRASQSAGLSRVFYTPQPPTARDRWNLVWVGVVGHFLYQWTFISGLARTSPSNGALIIGATPVVVAMLSSTLKLERVTRLHWVGALVSAVGLYFVVRSGTQVQGATLRGDLLILVAAACWAVYTVGAGQIIARHSPLYVTGMTMAIGGLPYAALMLPDVLRVDWANVSAWALVAVVASALLALVLSYLIWYAAVQRIGSARTSMYSNLVPIAAMGVAVVWLGESVPTIKLIGAALVITGVFLTRLGRPATAVPIEE